MTAFAGDPDRHRRADDRPSRQIVEWQQRLQTFVVSIRSHRHAPSPPGGATGSHDGGRAAARGEYRVDRDRKAPVIRRFRWSLDTKQGSSSSSARGPGALDVADHVVILEHGQVVQHGPIEEVFSRPARSSVARLLGFPNVLVVFAWTSRWSKRPSFCATYPSPRRSGATSKASLVLRRTFPSITNPNVGRSSPAIVLRVSDLPAIRQPAGPGCGLG